MGSIKNYLHRSKLGFIGVYLFSRVLNFLFKLLTNKHSKLPKLLSLKELERTLEIFVWAPDILTTSMFKLPHPWMKDAEIIQYGLTHTKTQTDCDEYATYASKALERIEGVYESNVLTVRWLRRNGVREGHNVAVYKYRTNNGRFLYGHIGNWGHFRGYFSIGQVVAHITRLGQGRLVAYAVATPSLKLVHYEKAK